MSTIRCDNFGPSAGGTTYSARGIAKAWVNFNGTGTIAARDSENVSSLTDNGTGDYTVTFSSAFDAANYSALGQTCGNFGVGAAGTMVFTSTSGTTEAAPTVSTYRIVGVEYAVAIRDLKYMLSAAYGDLA
jgi:hypothetical protein